MSKPSFPRRIGLPAPLRRLALATTLALSVFTAVAPMPAFAAQPIAQATVSMQTQEAAKNEAVQKQAVDGAVAEALRAVAGKNLKERGPQCVDSDTRCKADFALLTAEAQEAYRKIPLAAKQAMAKQLNGSFKLLGFIPVVNYRKAYEKGEAFGRDAFVFAIEKVNEKEQSGQLTPSNAHHARWFLQLSSRMTPAQRAGLLRIINQDVKLART